MDHDLLQVKMLDSFTITWNGRTVSDANGHSKMVWLLLAYLICARGRAVPGDELASLLWRDGGKSANPRNAMKTTFFRARTILDRLWEGAGHQLILRLNEGYAWNGAVPLELDLDRFRQLCAVKGPGRPQALEEAVRLYGGGFIPKLRDNAWAGEQAGALRKLYLKAVHALLAMLERQGSWKEAASLCAAALVQDPLNEELYCRRMNALIEQGDSRAAAQAFEDMNQIFLAETGGIPGEAAQALYRRAVSNVNDRRVPPAALLEQLNEESAPGAFFCDYDVFRALYRLQIRDAARTGEKVSLAVLTLTDQQDGELARRSLELAMENLRPLAQGLLRQGDAMAKCSRDQYVLLLPRADFESGRMVCQRIRKAFVRQYPHTPAKLRVTVCPAEVQLRRAGAL